MYQDLTLEFKNLSKNLVSEKQILEFFSKLSSENVKELSLVYDMSDYFKAKDQYVAN